MPYHSFCDARNKYWFIFKVLQGLNYLHNKCEIIHTDLKPENVLLSNSHQYNDKLVKDAVYRLKKHQPMPRSYSKWLGVFYSCNHTQYYYYNSMTFLQYAIYLNHTSINLNRPNTNLKLINAKIMGMCHGGITTNYTKVYGSLFAEDIVNIPGSQLICLANRVIALAVRLTHQMIILIT